MESRRSCLPIVERGCCCELRTCCKVQGWLAVIGSSIVVLRSIYSLVILAQMCSILAENSEDGKTCSDDPYRDVVTYTAIMNVLSVIIQLACVICAALFLQGIEKNEPGKMVHFVRLMWVQLVAGFLMVVVTAIMLSPLMLMTLIFFALPIYCLICANSLHILMSSGQTGGLYGIPNQKLGMETA